MKNIKQFEDFSMFTPKCIKTEKEFNTMRSDIITKLDQFYIDYNNFVNSVSPSNYRLTGHHFIELRNMRDDIQKFTRLNIKDLENDFIRDQVLTEEEKELYDDTKNFNL